MAGRKSQVYPKPAFDEGWVEGTVDYISGEQGWKRNFSTYDKDIMAFVYDDGGTFSWAVDVNGAQVASEWDRGSVEEAMAEAEEWVEAELAASIPLASRKRADVGALEHAKSIYDTVQFWYTEAYPTDDMGAEINPHITFEDCARRIAEGIGDGFYDYISAHDSLIRERIFDELSDLYGVDYDSIYHAWMYCDNRPLMGEKEFAEALPDAAAFCKIVEGGGRASRRSASDGWHVGDGYATKKYDGVDDWYNGDPYYGYAVADGFNITTSGGMILVEDDGYSSMEDAMEACDEHIEKMRNASRKTAASMGDNVRDWYMATFPTDDLGGDIYPHITFSNVALQLINHPGEDIYDYIGVGDSLVRERIFEQMSEILGCDYDVIYKAWLHGDDGSLKNVLLNHRASRKMSQMLPESVDYGVVRNGYDADDKPCILAIGHDEAISKWVWEAYASIDDYENGKAYDCGLSCYETEGAAIDALKSDGYRFASRKTAYFWEYDGGEYYLGFDSGDYASLIRGNDGSWSGFVCIDGEVIDMLNVHGSDFDDADEGMEFIEDFIDGKTASRKVAKNFPTLDEFEQTTNVFGDDRWVYEDDKFYMVIGKGLHGIASDDTWGWEIAWADQHSDLIAIDLNDTYSLEECYQDLRNDAFSGRIHSLWYDDMKDVVFGSRKTAQEQVEVNITGEYCDGYVYIERNVEMYDCEIEIEAWGDAGEEPVDAFVSVSADVDFFGLAREIIQEAEFEYGDELGIDVGELAGQLGLYFGKDAGRKANIGGDEAWENEIAELIASVLDLYDGDVASASDDTKMWLDERFAKAVELVRSGDVSASKTASSKKAYSDTFEYGFYDVDDEFRGGEVHIEDDGEGYGVWLVEIYGINGDSFEGYGSGDTPSQAARDAVENSDLKLSENEIQDFLDHLEFSMTDPFEGGWEGEF